MEALKMRVQLDNAGNLRGIYPGIHPNAPRLIIGSHLDTVPNAGAYDGILGVVLGIALVEALGGGKLPFEIELVGFSEEEGVRFGFPFIGSRAFVGTLDDALLRREDASGVSVAGAIERFGLDPGRLREAAFYPHSIAYLEFHIEQGPILEDRQQPLAVVDSISGQCRAAVTFEGQANHAGTTPMRFRRDALTAASEWINAVEAHARATDGLVATVGKLEIPGAGSNIIPGSVTALLDVRHPDDNARRAAFKNLLHSAARIAQRRNLGFSHVIQLDQNTVPMDLRLIAIAEQALEASGLEPVRMTSGAGHDAMIIAPVLPSVMLFLRSPGGVSHHPAETVLIEDVNQALQVGLHFLEALGSTLP